MKLQTLIVGVRFFTVVALCAFFAVFFLVDPDASGVAGVGFLSVSFFAAIFGICSLLLIRLMRSVLGDTVAALSLSGSFRQAGLLSLGTCALLALSHTRVLSWWTAGLVFVFVLLLELTIRKFVSIAHHEEMH